MILNLVDENTYMSLPASVRNKYATPVWMDIDYGDTLNVVEAREDKDEELYVARFNYPLSKDLIPFIQIQETTY